VRAGTEDKRKTTIAIALCAFAVLAVIYQLWPSSSTVPAPASTVARNTGTPAGPAPSGAAGRKGHRNTPVFSKLDPSLRLDLLKGSEETTYHGSGRDIFHSQAEPDPNVPKAPDPRENSKPIEVTHQNPPIPLKFYGFASQNDKKQIFLSQGEDVFVAREGDIVKGRYKVVHVNPNAVEIQDVLSNYSQSIPLTMPNS
jgi:hypothetical protein